MRKRQIGRQTDREAQPTAAVGCPSAAQRVRRRLAWLCLLAVALSAPKTVLAQTPAQKAAAQVLFEEARSLVKQGNWEDACPKFAESQKLDPAGGTLLNLANCYEKVGKTASAWILFVEAEADARRGGRKRRAEEAKRRSEALKPKLSTLRIDVPERVPGLLVKRGDEEVSAVQWGSSVPVDPGTHEITASAPGKKPWSETIEVLADAHEAVITVPALEDAPPEPAPKPKPDPGKDRGTEPPPDEASDGMVQWVLGWVTLSLGVGAAGAGTALKFVALDKDDQSLDHCLPDDPTQCDAEGVDLRDEARTMELISIIGWAVGGAAIATGVILLVTTPSSDDDEPTDEARFQLVPVAGPNGAGALLRATW